MGNRQSTKEKQKDKHPSNKDTKEAADKKETDQSSFARFPTPTSPDDLNHGESKGLTGATSQGLGPAKPDVPQNKEQSVPTTGDISQDADLVKSIPCHARVTQLYICLAKPEDPKTDITKPRLQQATPEKQKTTGLSQQQTNRQMTYGQYLHEELKSFTPSEQKPVAKETTEGPIQKTWTDGTRATADSVHNSDVSASAQVLHKDASPQVASSEVVRDVTTENPLSREADMKMKARINKSPSQKTNCVSSNPNEESIDSTCRETDRAHGLAEQSTSTKPGVAEPPASTPTELPNHSTQTSNQPRTQVNNEENALQESGLNHNSVTNVISVNYQYCFRAKSESSRANAAKLRLRQKLAKKLKAHPQDGSKSSQQTAEETVTEQESSQQQQGCTATGAKEHKKLHQIPQHNKLTDCDTSVNPAEPQVPEVEQRPAAASNTAASHHPTTAAADANVKLRLQCQLKVSVPQDTAVKTKKKCTFINQNQPKENSGNVAAEEKLNGNNGHAGKERPEPAFSPAPGPEHKVHNEGRWHPFTVNQSCPHKARCHHNPGKGLPPNVQKWFDECPNYLREPPRVTTAKLAACLTLRETQEEAGDSHQ